jgi:tetratricopeptide (TPR) repeat protein
MPPRDARDPHAAAAAWLLLGAAALLEPVAHAQDTPSAGTSQQVTSFVAPDDATPESERRTLYEAYRFKYEATEYEEALKPAERLLEVTELELGSQSGELIQPLIDLAALQEINGDVAGAWRNYLRSVELIELHYGENDRRLVEPLTALGKLNNAAGRYEDAIPLFERARYLLRRHEGLWSIAQTEQLVAESKIYLALDDLPLSMSKQAWAYEISLREYGQDSPELIPSLYQLAEHLSAIYTSRDSYDKLYFTCLIERKITWSQDERSICPVPAERELYHKAIDIVEMNYGKDDPRLVEPLIRLAESYRDRAARDASGQYVNVNYTAKSAVDRALAIIESNPDVDKETRVAALVAMGDWYLRFSPVWDKGFEHYRKAWEAAGGGEDGNALTGRYFDAAVNVYMPAVRPAMRRAHGQWVSQGPIGSGYVLMRFDVDAEGFAQNIEVVEAQPPDWRKQERYVSKALRVARYRPRFEAGEPVWSEGERLRYEFIYPE